LTNKLKERKEKKKRNEKKKKVLKQFQEFLSTVKDLAENRRSAVLEKYASYFGQRNIEDLEKLMNNYPFLIVNYVEEPSEAGERMLLWEINLFEGLEKEESNRLRDNVQFEIIRTNLKDINEAIKDIRSKQQLEKGKEVKQRKEVPQQQEERKKEMPGEQQIFAQQVEAK